MCPKYLKNLAGIPFLRKLCFIGKTLKVFPKPYRKLPHFAIRGFTKEATVTTYKVY